MTACSTHKCADNVNAIAIDCCRSNGPSRMNCKCCDSHCWQTDSYLIGRSLLHYQTQSKQCTYKPSELPSLPPNIPVSPDGEEGYLTSQLSLLHRRRHAESTDILRPPPNKTVYDRDRLPPPPPYIPGLLGHCDPIVALSEPTVSSCQDDQCACQQSSSWNGISYTKRSRFPRTATSDSSSPSLAPLLGGSARVTDDSGHRYVTAMSSSCGWISTFGSNPHRIANQTANMCCDYHTRVCQTHTLVSSNQNSSDASESSNLKHIHSSLGNVIPVFSSICIPLSRHSSLHNSISPRFLNSVSSTIPSRIPMCHSHVTACSISASSSTPAMSDIPVSSSIIHSSFLAFSDMPAFSGAPTSSINISSGIPIYYGIQTSSSFLTSSTTPSFSATSHSIPTYFSILTSSALPSNGTTCANVFSSSVTPESPSRVLFDGSPVQQLFLAGHVDSSTNLARGTSDRRFAVADVDHDQSCPPSNRHPCRCGRHCCCVSSCCAYGTKDNCSAASNMDKPFICDINCDNLQPLLCQSQ